MALAFASLTSYPPTTTTAAVSNATGAVWAYPSGIVAGDALILCAVNNNPNGGSGASGTSFSLPTGWTVMESQPGIITDTSAYLYEKTAVGTESGTSITLRPSATALVAAAILRYTGANPGTPFGDTVSAITSGSSTTTSPAKGTLSPAPGATDMVVRMYGWALDSSGAGAAATVPTSAGTAGWSTRLNNFTNVGSSFNCGLVVLDKVNGTDNVTVTAVSSGWMVGDAAIKAAPTSSARPTNINQAVKRAAYY